MYVVFVILSNCQFIVIKGFNMCELWMLKIGFGYVDQAIVLIYYDLGCVILKIISLVKIWLDYYSVSFIDIVYVIIGCDLGQFVGKIFYFVVLQVNDDVFLFIYKVLF